MAQHESINDLDSCITQAVIAIKAGKVIGYPTESVYGFGADPFIQKAVEAIFKLKGRATSNPFILIASHIDQALPLIDTDHIDQQMLAQLTSATERPTTWVCPAHPSLPAWLLGPDQTIALRITQHPFAKALCDAAGQAIISTSANYSGEAPATSYAQMQPFKEQLAVIIDAPCGDANQPSRVVDLRTQYVYRD